MIVFKNSLISLDYNPEYDILSFDWPDIGPAEKAVFVYMMDQVVETMKSYNVKNLLIDVSHSVVTIPAEEYQKLLIDLGEKTKKTAVRRVARVTTFDPERESNVKEVRESSPVPYQYHDFRTKEDAIRWLKYHTQKEGK